MSINSISISGRLTRDPELKQAGNYVYAKLSVAVDHYSPTNPTVSYIDIKVWGDKKAPAIVKHLVKGKLVFISGEIKQERWEKDGQKKSNWAVNAREVIWEFPAKDGAQEKPTKSMGAPKEEYDDDDIPF